MAVPNFVATLDDYCWWIKGVVESSGGRLFVPPDGEVDFQEAPLRTTLSGVDIPGVVVDTHHLVFWDQVPHMLEFDFDVSWQPDGTLEYGQAHYHFRSQHRDLIWRYDKHEGHAELGEWHKHVDHEDNRVMCQPVDLHDAINEIRESFGWPKLD